MLQNFAPGTALRWSAVAALFAAGAAFAIPPHRQALKKYYGVHLAQSLHQCATCHLSKDEAPDRDEYDPEAPPHNVFGERLARLGEELEAEGKPTDVALRLEAVANEDADGDGVPNEIEILLGRHAGRPEPPPEKEAIEEALRKQDQLRERSNAYRWAPFRRVERPAIPSAEAQGDWAANPIDAFIAEGYAAHGMAPNPPAPRHVLLRRAYLDLVGLPPTAEEVQSFAADPSPDAFDRAVDRLLASPAHGERWGRHWMDVWRYSDWAGWTDGGQIRDSQPHIWRWRDWIIESLNADKGYDRMVREMLAGDELAPEDPAALAATGFLVRNYKMLSRETWLQDAVEHTGKAFLGLTLNCARCHDHVYDPIAQEEYFQFRAIFEPHNVRLDRVPGQPDPKLDGLPRVYDAEPAAKTYVFVRGDDRNPDQSREIPPGPPSCVQGGAFEVAAVPLPTGAYYPALDSFVAQETLAAARARVADAQAKLTAAQQASSGNEQAESLEALDFRAAETELASLEARLAADRVKHRSPDSAELAELSAAAARAEHAAQLAAKERDLAGAERALAELQQASPVDEGKVAEAQKKRDAAAAERDRAAAQAPGESYSSVGPVYPSSSTGRRAALARWLTGRENPLAARVAVNHLWRRHFGQAIVASTFDFGQNGSPPSHPALLDWLAAEFMESSAPGGEWSMKHLHRLTATSAAYALSSSAAPAALAADPENRWLARAATRRMEAELVRDGVLHLAGGLDRRFGGADIDHNLGMSVARRSLYFRHAPEKQMPFLKLFDAAAVTECYERKSSVVPQQALALANSELVRRESRRLARDLHQRAPDDDIAFASAAYLHILARPARGEEVDACLEFLADRAKAYASAAGERAGAAGPDDLDAPSADPRVRARESLVHVLFNHNDFVAVR